MSDITDQEIFDAAVGGTPIAEPEPTHQPEPPVAEAPHEPQPEATPEPASQSPNIPPSRLREEAEARRRAEQRAAELEKLVTRLAQPQAPAPQAEPAAAPEIWSDPDQWFQHQQAKVQQEMRAQLMFNARLLAGQLHTPEKVDQAVSAFDEAYQSGRLHPAEHQRIMNSPNPFHEAVQWHKKDVAVSTVGDDIEAFKQKVIADYLAQNAQPTAAPSGVPGQPVIKIPTSLNRTTAAASNDPGAGANVPSDAELFNQATSRRR